MKWCVCCCSCTAVELACKEADEVARLIEKAEEAHLCRNGEFFKDKLPPKILEENGVHERSTFKLEWSNHLHNKNTATVETMLVASNLVWLSCHIYSGGHKQSEVSHIIGFRFSAESLCYKIQKRYSFLCNTCLCCKRQDETGPLLPKRKQLS